MIAQAGAIAVRGEPSDVEVLIVRARTNPADWIFPKGHIEPGEKPADTAVRELREEAGVVGDAIAPVGISRFTLGGKEIEVNYFLVRFRGFAPPSEQREMQWVPLSEAKQKLSFADARRLLDEAEAALKSQG